MPHRFTGERTLMRIYIGENDHCLDADSPHHGKPLYETLLLTLRDRGFAGATVIRAIAGFGASADLHYDKLLRLSADLPIILEVVDTREKLEAIMPELDRLIGGGLVTLEKVEVILYRPKDARDDERWRDRVRGLTPEPDADGS